MIFHPLALRLSSCLIAAILFLTTGCSTEDSENTENASNDSIVAPNPNLQLKGQNFMVPSPVQIAAMVKGKGALYNKSMLNPAASGSKYSDDLKKALNLGVYGADLGYVTMYENSGDALEYYKTVMSLGEQLKITGSFDKDLLERFGKNIGNKDSSMKLVGETYRRSDEFLKNGERSHIAALVLTGGWVESMYFAIRTYEQVQSQDIAIRIGEQKNTCRGILRLLTEQEKPEFQQLIFLFNELNQVYSQIEIKYTFIEPVTDNGKKITTINGKTDVTITPAQLVEMKSKIISLRSYIVD